jgi:hypothetical protein
MDVSSEIRPGHFTPRESPGLGGSLSPSDGVGHGKPRAATNRNIPARSVTKAEQRVASGVAATADGRVFSCQWRLVAESAISMYTQEIDVYLCLSVTSHSDW